MKRLQWLPNAITLSRSLIALASFIFVLHNKWAIGLWLLLIAISTDFLDGLAAKKLNASTKFGEAFDALTDSLTVFFGFLGLSITGYLSWWVTIVVILGGLLVGSDRAFDQPVWRWRAPVAVTSLFLAWIFIAWFYAYLAFGWTWLYVPLTIFILIACGLLKKHRLQAWLQNV